MQPDENLERVSWIRPECCRGWEFLIAHSSKHYWTIYHETYAVCASLISPQTWKYRGQTHNLGGAAGIMLMEPGEIHRTLSLGPGSATFKVAFIEPAELEAAAQESGLPGLPHFRRAKTNDPGLTQALWKLGLATERAGYDTLALQTMQATAVQRLLGYAERAPRLPSRAQDLSAVARAKDYLQEHYYRSVTLDELSCAAHVSKYWLVHAFTRALGLPPHTYQLQVRMARARQLLGRGVLGTQAALDLGFADQAHFIRHFKRVMGVTPGEYRRSVDPSFQESPQE